MKIYTIKKGNHYSGFRFSPFLRKRYAGAVVRFTPSCAYSLPPEEQADTNKLFGFTLGCPSNSVRWGWKSRGAGSDKIILLPYVHDGGEIVRPSGRIEILIGETAKLGILREGRTVLFTHYDDVVGEHRFSRDLPRFGYRLWPHFGGTCPAPHDIEILADIE